MEIWFIYLEFIRKDNYEFKIGLKVKVICNHSTMFAKVGEIGVIDYKGTPEYPGWIVKFKSGFQSGYKDKDNSYIGPILFKLLGLFGRCEHLFEHQLELLEWSLYHVLIGQELEAI